MALADSILARIQAEREMRFGSLNLPAGFIAPNYGGRSIVNISSSVVQILGGRLGTAPLDAPIVAPLAGGVRRVVLVIVDALGYEKLRKTLEANPQNGFHALLKGEGQLVPLTSVFPSTTTAALTALWTGYTPAEHGFMGFQLFLREYGVRAQMINFSPVATERMGNQQLLAAGLEPDKFLAVPSLPQTLAESGVPVYNFLEQAYAKSVLSRVQIRGQRETRGFVTSSDMWVDLRVWLERRPAEPALFVAYWSKIDTLAHVYGPSSETLAAEIDNLAYTFEREFLRRLSPAAREGTLFLLTADHGQIDTPPAEAVYLRDHPALRDSLVMDFTGDPRAAYLTVRNGEAGPARRYLETCLGGDFFVLDSQAALGAGLFGGGTHAGEARFRIGDLLVLPLGRQFLHDGSEVPRMLGRHGGLAPEEMLVPLLAARLDG